MDRSRAAPPNGVDAELNGVQGCLRALIWPGEHTEWWPERPPVRGW